MKRTVPISEIIAWPFLLPGNLACDVFGFAKNRDLVRMLINSLFWTVLGVVVVLLVT